MRLMLTLLVPLLVVACGAPAPTARPVAACHPTQPNGDTPPGEDQSPTFHGNGRLYTSALAAQGEILADPTFVAADGSIAIKFAWWRAPGVGAAGDLVITGQERTTGASIVASIPDGYGQRFQASGITFPTEGCYQITARSGDAELAFVVKVTKVAEPGPST